MFVLSTEQDKESIEYNEESTEYDEESTEYNDESTEYRDYFMESACIRDFPHMSNTPELSRVVWDTQRSD